MPSTALPLQKRGLFYRWLTDWRMMGVHWRWDCKGFQGLPYLHIFIPTNFNFEPLIIRRKTHNTCVDAKQGAGT